MTRRAWLLASVIVASGVIAIAMLSTRDQPMAPTRPVATRAGEPPAQLAYRGHAADPALPAEPPEEIGVAVPTVRIAGSAYADNYASELCGCADPACADEVRERYSRNLGMAQPEVDSRKIHEAFTRAADCQRTIAERASKRALAR